MSPGQVDPVIERDNPGGYSLAYAGTLAAVTETAVVAESKITILYDAFGDDAGMKKDWSFSALVEVAGKRILFDTGNNRDIFAANVKAKNIDLTNLDFVILSHRHSEKQAFRNRCIYAGVGTSLPLVQSTGPGERRGDGPVLEDDDLTTYRKLARREDPFGVRSRSLR